MTASELFELLERVILARVTRRIAQRMDATDVKRSPPTEVIDGFVVEETAVVTKSIENLLSKLARPATIKPSLVLADDETKH